MTTEHTTIDHAAEAREHLEDVEAYVNAAHSFRFTEEEGRAIQALSHGGLSAQSAQVHATLALVEAQREANEIARIQTLLTLPAPPEELRETPVDDLGRERMERILKGLGLP